MKRASPVHKDGVVLMNPANARVALLVAQESSLNSRMLPSVWGAPKVSCRKNKQVNAHDANPATTVRASNHIVGCAKLVNTVMRSKCHLQLDASHANLGLSAKLGAKWRVNHAQRATISQVVA